MIQRMIALIAALVIGLALFISGIVNGDITIITIGFLIAALPCFFFGWLIYAKVKDKTRYSGNKGKFTIIYRLLSKKTFDSYTPSNSGNITKGAAYVAYNNVKNKKNASIKIKKERAHYTPERVTKLIHSFATAYHNPKKITEYFFENANHFPCTKSVLSKAKQKISQKSTEFNKAIDELYMELWDDFAERDESVTKFNISILKNHEEKETTGLGFGLITNSASHAMLYSAMDADEREYQRLSNAPRLSSTEEEDNKKLQEIYDKIIAVYNEFIENVCIILSNELLYQRNEAEKCEDGTSTIDNQEEKDKYILAHKYLKENKYDLAIDLFYELEGYEDSEYWYDYLNIQTNTKINCGDFVKKYQLTTFEIPSNRTSIYDEFNGCSSLQSIIIPNSIVDTDFVVFKDCNSLTSVTIGNNVTGIGAGAFYYCPIETATLPATLLYCLNKRKLKKVVITGGSTIYEEAFQYCKSLTSVEIPNSVEKIGKYAFDGCRSLTSIEIPNSVEKIGSDAFVWCDSLTIYCEATEKPSGWDSCWNALDCPVVWDCKNNDVADDGYIYIVIDGVRYGVKDGEAIVVEQAKNITTANILSSIAYKGISYSVKSIGDSAFEDCDSLTSIEIPNSVEKIGEYAFDGCDSLTIYCEATEKPSGWDSDWNDSDCPVIWGYTKN